MKHLTILILGLLLSLATARAEAPPTCQGTDLLAQLKTEHAVEFDAVMAKAGAVPNGEAVFWKIEREGVEPSYLLGTAHVTDPRVTTLSPMMTNALEAADIVALELKELGSQQEFMMAAMRHAALMVLPPGQSLWDLVPDADEAAIRDNVNLPPGAAKTIFGYQPWVVAAMLSVPICETSRKQAGIQSLDAALARQAEIQGSELAGLETVEEQLTLFANMPLDLQTKYLVSVARLGNRTSDFFETLISLYEQRRITAYMPLMLKLEPMDKDGEAMMAFVEEELTRKRNHTMARRAEKLLARGNAFIAVGALHLPGEEGLVELIRKSGYKVTPLN